VVAVVEAAAEVAADTTIAEDTVVVVAVEAAVMEVRRASTKLELILHSICLKQRINLTEYKEIVTCKD